MKRFKSFLLEYITDEQRERYKDVHMTDKARADTDHFFGVGNDKVHGEMEHGEKSEIHKQLENHLGREISHEDYHRGTVKDKYNRDVKIGRLVKDNDLRNQFDRDPARAIGKAPTIKTTTVRGVEVIGQTNPAPNAEHPKGHAWKDFSCKNVEDGMNRRYLKPEIQHGTVVHFAHDQNGEEIYRATIHPHHNSSGDVAYAVDAEYGIKHPKFTEDANRVAKELSGKFKPGQFTKHSNVYNDSGQREIFHPNATSEDISHILKHGTNENKHEVMSHAMVNTDHISHIMDHEPDASLRARAVRKAIATPEHTMKGLNDPATIVKRAAVYNDLNSEHVSRAIQSDQPAEIRREAIRDVAATPEHISHVIQHDPDTEVVRSALANRNSTFDHITMALKRPEKQIRRAAISSTKITPEHIAMAVKDPDSEVMSTAVQHTMAKPEHISHVIKHGSETAVYAALNPYSNANSDHIHHVVSSNDPRFTPDIKHAAVMHPNASSQDVTNAVKKGDADFHYDMVRSHPNLNDESISHMLAQGDHNVMGAISRRRDLAPEHIDHILKHGRYQHRRNIISANNLTPEHMEHIVKHEPTFHVRASLFDRIDVPQHVVSHAIRHDPDEYVRYQAITNEHAHPDDLAHAAMHDDDDVNIAVAIRQPNIPLHAVQHVADKYKRGSLGQMANTVLQQRTQGT